MSDEHTPPINTGGWVDHQATPTRRDFPAQGSLHEPLRVAFTSQAHADVLAHAQEDLDRELCGVLLGTVCQDSHGVWVSAEVALRGETDKQGGTHVTYTQKTWEKIYEIKEQQYPQLLILGWYHTHPGFGVQFSEMDLFIQRNFFAGETQFALVVDPLSGDEALLANTVEGTRYIGQFYVDGKSRRAVVPASESASKAGTDGATADPADGGIAAGVLDDRLRSIEARLDQVLQSNEQQRESHGRLFLTCGFLCVLMIAGYIAYSVVQRTWDRSTPPKDLQMVQVPVRINDKVMLVGMQIKGWEIPDGENLLANVQAEAEQQALAQALQVLEARDPAATLTPVDADRPFLSPWLTYCWAVAATIVAFWLLVLRYWKQEPR